MRYRARHSLGVGGERRVERPVVGGVVADDVDHWRARAACIVHIGQAIGETRSAVQQGRCGFAGHSRVAVGAAGDHGLGHPQNATDAFDLVERRDEMHFGCARIGKAGIDAAGDQRSDEAFSAVHDKEFSSLRFYENAPLPGSLPSTGEEGVGKVFICCARLGHGGYSEGHEGLRLSSPGREGK